MSVRVAEYLGQRVDVVAPVIVPYNDGVQNLCPFMNDVCSKIKSHNPPVCSVRKDDGTLWIVCKDRLCATKRDIPLSQHQIGILQSIANTIYGSPVDKSDILIKKETKIPFGRIDGKKRQYKADFVMIRKTSGVIDPVKVVLEMQGGGETINTGKLTEHIHVWDNTPDRSNLQLNQLVSQVSPLITNAWRRQQEQFFVKGNVGSKLGEELFFVSEVYFSNT